MELLIARHPDFTLTIENDNFLKVFGKARRNIGEENLVSLWQWTEDEAEVELHNGEGPLPLANGEMARAVFFDNADYPVWVEFNLPVKTANLSLPGRLSTERGSNAKEAFAFRERSRMLTGFINYGNEIGRSYIRINYTLPDGQKRQWQLDYEVLSTKLNYHDHWRTIVDDIESEYRMLSLDFMRRTFHSFNPDSSSSDSPDIIWWSIFNGLQKRFIKAARSIIEQPRHRLRDIPEYRRAERIIKFTTQLEEEYAEHKNEDNHLYRTMQPTNSNDTLENRFLRHALQNVSSRYNRLYNRIRQTVSPSPQMLEEMEKTDCELKRLSRHPFFRTVGIFKGLTQESQVLQKASGYSQIYRSWIILNKSYSLEEGLHTLETKDIATLYEIWCYIQVKKIVEQQLGEDTLIDNRNRLEMGPMFAYNLSKGQNSSIIFRKDDVELAELIYNPQEETEDSSETGIEGLVSPTVPQRPDIVLQLTKDDIETGMKMTYLFDAKYRIDRQREGVDNPPEDAINQMHRYRDAIYYAQDEENRQLKKEVIGGYILFPGSGDADNMAHARFLESIQQVNIGAFPLRPNDTENRRFLENFIGEIVNTNARQILTHENVIPQKGLKYNYSDGETEDYLLVGFLEDGVLPLVEKNRLYYVRAGERHGSLHLAPGYESAKFLLLHNKNERRLYRLKGDGPRVMSGEDLRKKGFASSGNYYLAYELESSLPIDLPGLDITKISLRGIGNRSADPYIVPLPKT